MATNNTTEATIAALLAAGLDTASDSIGGIDSFAMPDPDVVVFPIGGSKATHVQVSFHRDPRGRTIEAKIDRAQAPLTGDYTLEIDGVPSTYDATAGVPANIDDLIQAWASQILTDNSTFAVSTRSSSQSSDLIDTIRVTSPVNTGAYTTFVLGALTAAPELAALAMLVEVDAASVRVWTYPGYTLDRGDEMLPLELQQALAPILQADLGARSSGGWGQRMDNADIRGVWLELYTPVRSDALVVVGSGPGVYVETVVTTVIVAPQRIP